MIDRVLHFLEQDKAAALKRLGDLLAIPSVSTDPAYRADVARAADHLQALLGGLLGDVQVHQTAGHPIVLARSTDQDVQPQAQAGPRVLFYGHYDVQPPDPLDQWQTPPFKPTVRNGAIHARGASDDKGQVACFLEALRAWRQAGPDGKLPVHVTVLLEGEEECGSIHLPDFLKQHADLLAGDVVLICDTTMWDPQTVAITYGLRGLLYYDIRLHGPSRDLHSGMYGGILANPLNELVAVLGRLFDQQHRVTIPGFYDDVLRVSPEEQQAWAKLDFSEQADCLSPVGVDTPFGEAGYTTLERRWVRPACDINGLYGGYGGAGAKTVIPAMAGAKVSFRLAPNQDPARIATLFEQWLHSHDVHGCRWELQQHGQAHPVITPRDSPFVDAAARAVERSSGKRPVLVREGATIPVVSDFQRLLGLDSLLIGFGLAGDRIHSPNEKFDLSCFELGCRTLAVLLAELGQQPEN